MPQWIINPYGDNEETDIIVQEELIEISNNEDHNKYNPRK